jgi:predicted CxxxxCH...CXXCH cytochrome family protein
MRARGFPLDQCKTCHGSTYTGGLIVTKSCQESGCHADASGIGKSPESCNTCHGNFRAAASLTGPAYLLSAAPPKSVVGDTAQTIAGVGAHQKHLATGTTGRTVKCQECHTVPAAVRDAGHLGAAPAEIAFNDTLARLTTAIGPITPSYSSATVTCSNTYCHGNWGLRRATSSYQFAYADTMMEGAGTAPLWTAGAAQSQCYSCHGTAGAIVPKGHIPATPTTCANCHTGVIDALGNIIDKTRHINGKVNVFGTERAF